MKKFWIFLIAVLAITMAVGTAFAEEGKGGFPTSGKYTIAGGSSGAFKQVYKGNGQIELWLPFFEEQGAKHGVKPEDFEVCASVSKNTGGSDWVLLTAEKYNLPTRVEKGFVVGTLDVSKVEGAYVWPRIWAENKNKAIKDDHGKMYLWIDQKSPYTRANEGGKPSYETITRTADGVYKSPKELGDYQLRK